MEHEHGAFKVNREIRPWSVQERPYPFKKAFGVVNKSPFWPPI
jgi:hypothetical protein